MLETDNLQYPGRWTLVSILLAITVVLSACGNYERRSAGTTLDDQTLEIAVIDNIYSGERGLLIIASYCVIVFLP